MKRAKNDKEWLGTQEKINSYLTNILFKIEWHYGEGRTPYVFPTEYTESTGNSFRIVYRCIIQLEFYEGEKIKYKSDIPSEVFDQIKKDFNKRFFII